MRRSKQVFSWRRGLRPALLTVLFLLWLFSGKAQTAGPAVTITEFSDFQCPYCQRAAVVVEQLRQSYGDNVKFVFKQMPLPMHQYAFKAAQAAVIRAGAGQVLENAPSF